MEIGSWWERIDIFKLFIMSVRNFIVRRINTTLVALRDQDFYSKMWAMYRISGLYIFV